MRSKVWTGQPVGGKTLARLSDQVVEFLFGEIQVHVGHEDLDPPRVDLPAYLAGQRAELAFLFGLLGLPEMARPTRLLCAQQGLTSCPPSHAIGPVSLINAVQSAPAAKDGRDHRAELLESQP